MFGYCCVAFRATIGDLCVLFLLWLCDWFACLLCGLFAVGVLMMVWVLYVVFVGGCLYGLLSSWYLVVCVVGCVYSV